MSALLILALGALLLIEGDRRDSIPMYLTGGALCLVGAVEMVP